MTYKGKLNHKGQITIPVAIRRRHNLHPGQSVVIDDSTDAVRIKPAAELESLLGLFATTKKYNRDKAHEAFVSDVANRKF